jgi:DNA integrity scanning protein DisA with diadenylate cyclase activity
MELTLSIPALLFPAISLSQLAYNARYLAIAALIRQLHGEYLQTSARPLKVQIDMLNKRMSIIKNMQAMSILSFFLSAVTMFLIFIELPFWANLVFGASLVFLIFSLLLSFWEVQLSTRALGVQLDRMNPDKEPDRSNS